MATYATLADLAENAAPGTIQDLSDALKLKALTAFSSEADTYLRSQETLPLSEPYDPALVRHVCAGAAWQLLSYKGFNPEVGSNLVLEKNYDRAIAWLKSLARGEVSLAKEADASTGRLGGFQLQSDPCRGWGGRFL